MKARQLLFVGLGVLIVGVWLVWCPIIKRFPWPTGEYGVGYRTAYMSGSHQTDMWIRALAPSARESRSLSLHAWYPAERLCDHRRVPYVERKVQCLSQRFAEQYPRLAPMAPLLLGGIMINAYNHAPLPPKGCGDPYPVILYSHGLLGLPSDVDSPLLIDLASHGFVVVGIDHTYLNAVTVDREGNVFRDKELAAAFAAMSSAEQEKFQADAIVTYQHDMRWVLDELARWNEDARSPFYRMLDMHRIGVMGHSAGGTAALAMGRADERVRACVDLDGWYDQAISWEPMPIPTLLLFASQSIEIAEPTQAYLQRKGLTREQYCERERRIMRHRHALCAESDNCAMRVIQGAGHGDFGGLFFKWPLRPWNARSGAAIAREVNDEVINFFKRSL